METTFYKLLLSRTKAPERVTIRIYDNKYPFITSLESTNDTLDWFHVNSNALENCLQEHGLSWCYIFETAPKQLPCIYMFFGKEISKENMEDIMCEEINALEKGKNFYFEDDSFSLINVDKYDNSITELEKELTRKASDIFRVYEP